MPYGPLRRSAGGRSTRAGLRVSIVFWLWSEIWPEFWAREAGRGAIRTVAGRVVCPTWRSRRCRTMLTWFSG
jgi:hypothetical protein